ncbi:uncharacterized protein LOC113315429 [Papaver somniferum]|uniref:uncharacterized protein LOC113315429 n=1 Tax=Papaver somniferum TaxID=3469 RepID=UPI000E701154|nr:uncharacterized protein LOC113315429 [Papaver somniferum]
MIHAAVQSDPSLPEWLLSCMYGYCNYAKKKAQWDFIKDIGLNISQPWVFMGDLNIHLLDNTSSVSSSSDSMVHSILQEIGLEDLGFLGKGHTWSSNNTGTGEKRSRIDMSLVNVEWNSVFNDSKLLHLSQLGSDHCPIMLVTDYSQPKLWKPFKLFLS